MKLSVSVLMLLTLGAVGEVVENFTKVVDCGKFFLNGEPPEFKIGTQIGTASQGCYVPICQRYKNKYHYATLYDTAEKIPVYSAYRYERTPDCTGKRPVLTWMIEPQLENNNNGGEMILQKQMKINRQAYNSEYEDSRYDKGHLFPFCHTNSEEAAESTFTLTNAAPQRCDFNKMWYSKVEYRVRKNLTDCLNASKRAYVVTGVVPSKEKQTLKKGSTVNVPSHFWTAYCCCDNNSKCKFGAYIMHKEADEPTNYEDEELIDFHKDLDELYKPMTMKVFNEKYITGEKRRRIQ